jgi:hypothetical protein
MQHGAATTCEGLGSAAGLGVTFHALRAVVGSTGPWLPSWHHVATVVVVVTFGLSATTPSSELLGFPFPLGLIKMNYVSCLKCLFCCLPKDDFFGLSMCGFILGMPSAFYCLGWAVCRMLAF